MSADEVELAAIALFERYLEQPPADRDAWLDRRTEERTELRRRLAEMRDADQRDQLRTGAASDAIADVRPPERIGAYRIVGLIGRGGMGSVYRGERDLGDFTHAVAIKLIKPGLLSETLIDRFRRERQTLAQMRHPNIAQLHDGGETPDGAPYIVMELVEGEPLIAWAEARALSADARAQLFVTICGAVAFAHRNLVVHRDLTPSNILITTEGQPNLIDFGIAKPAEDAAAAQEDEAQASIVSLSLTPGFAAPERLRSTRVTTAADIYSLGRILAALIGDPDRDLDAIVARACAPEPGDRYPTAEEIAADVEAWRTGFPVAARARQPGYVFRRFVTRHRVGVAIGIAALALLLGTLGYALVANHRAQLARAESERRFADVHALAGYMLFDLTAQLGRVPGNTAARAALAERAQRYLGALAASPGGTDGLSLETARGLIRLAEIQGVPNAPNLGERARAIANLDGAGRLLSTMPDAPGVKVARARLAIDRGLIVLHDASEQKQARALLREAAGLLGAVPLAERDGAKIDAQRSLRTAQLDFADVAGERPLIAKIVAAMEQDRRAWPASLRESDAGRIDGALAAYYLGLLASETDMEHAIDLHLAAERLYEDLLERHRDEPLLLYRAAWNAVDGFVAASSLGREEISARLIRKAVTIVDRLAIIDDRDDAIRALQTNIKEAYSQSLRDADRFAEALAVQREVIALRLAALPKVPNGRQLGNAGFSFQILGIIARDAGNRTLACESWTRSVAHLNRAAALGQLNGFHGSFRAGLHRHVEACRTGASIASPLR